MQQAMLQISAAKVLKKRPAVDWYYRFAQSGHWIFDKVTAISITGCIGAGGFRGNYQSEVVLGDIPETCCEGYEEACPVCETDLRVACA